jgi:hypothetical protein
MSMTIASSPSGWPHVDRVARRRITNPATNSATKSRLGRVLARAAGSVSESERVGLVAVIPVRPRA